MNPIHHTALVLLSALLAACGKPPASSPQNNSNPSPPVEVQPFRGKVFRSLNKELVITFVSSDELELANRGTTYLCKYTDQADALRVILTANGTNQVLYFRHVPDGLRSNDGVVLLSPERYADFPLERCLHNAKQIGIACTLYMLDNDGVFPNDLNQLFPKYLPDRRVFSSPLAPQEGNVDYEYFGAGAKETDGNDKILLRGRYTTPDGKRSVVRLDGRGSIERQ